MSSIIPTDVHSLPPELLAQIFDYLATSFMFREGEMHSKCQKQYFCMIGTPLDSARSPYQWLSVTEVCHYWRDVALSTSSLWSNFTLSNMAMTNTMLERSSARVGRDIAIQARLERECQEQLKTFNYIVSQVSRVSSLDLVIDKESLEEIAPSLSNMDPHCLKKLSLVHDRHGSILCGIPDFHFPSLTEFSASEIEFRALKPYLLPTLRSLSVYFVSDRCRYQLPELLSVLESMPLLEDLTLVGALQATPSIAVAQLDVINERSVVFSHLKSLHISDYGVTVASFLAHVTLVKPAKLFLRLTAFYNSNELRLALDSFRTFIPRIVEYCWKDTLKSILLRSNEEEGELELKAWIRNPLYGVTAPPLQSDADLIVLVESGRRLLMSAIEGLCSALNPSLNHIHSAHLLGKSTDMLQMLDSLNSLNYLRLSSNNLQSSDLVLASSKLRPDGMLVTV
ncbi:hypothetical protein QCA50_011159 [Cerrena zonata]|uniref:F-box domain-containing protein n=1 Tax=Cerrena zonata TaxID=2478898 RepID=A0AAW0FXM6_9APHY